jgi:hypothetical protein
MHRLISFMTAVGLLVVTVATVRAAAPGNDALANATILTSFPFHQTVDMTEATSEGIEPWCGGAYLSAWYRYTATAEQTLYVSIPDAETSTRVCVLPDSVQAGTYFIQSPGDTRPVILDAGRTYIIELAVLEGGGSATLDLDVGPPLFDAAVTLDRTVVERASGAAVISGTVRCAPAGVADLFVEVTEKAGAKRIIDMAVGTHLDPCGPSPTPWTVRVIGGAAYVPGNADIRLDLYAGDNHFNDYDLVRRTVHLGAK